MLASNALTNNYWAKSQNSNAVLALHISKHFSIDKNIGFLGFWCSIPRLLNCLFFSLLFGIRWYFVIWERIQTKEVVKMAAMVPVGMDFWASCKSPDLFDPAMIPANRHLYKSYDQSNEYNWALWHHSSVQYYLSYWRQTII